MDDKRGRPPRGVEIMLRMYLLANWFTLSDEGVEDAIYDSYAFRKFLKVDFLGGEQVPDATTLCKFRKLLKRLASPSCLSSNESVSGPARESDARWDDSGCNDY